MKPGAKVSRLISLHCCTQKMAARVIVFFISHICLIPSACSSSHFYSLRSKLGCAHKAVPPLCAHFFILMKFLVIYHRNVTHPPRAHSCVCSNRRELLAWVFCLL